MTSIIPFLSSPEGVLHTPARETIITKVDSQLPHGIACFM